MRTIGHWSIASVINFMVSLFAFGAGLAIIFSTLLLLAGPFVRLPITVSVPVSFTLENMPDEVLSTRPAWGFDFRETRRPPAPRTSRMERVEGSVRIQSTSRLFIMANGVALIGVLIYVFVVLMKVRGVLRTLIFGKKPFVPDNAARIRFIGLAILLGEVTRMVFVWAENMYVRSQLTIPGVTFDLWPQLSFRTVFVSLLILIIAEVFRQGTQLDQDQSLTI